MTQPEALRLADALLTGSHHRPVLDRSATELRRLHAVNQELGAALRLALPFVTFAQGSDVLHEIRAAIAKAEGELK
jgi:hypothetical protein